MMTTFQFSPIFPYTQPYDNYPPNDEPYLFPPQSNQPRSPNDQHTLHSSFARFDEAGVECSDPAHYMPMKYSVGVAMDFDHGQAEAMRGGQQAIEEHRRGGEGEYSPISVGSSSPVSGHSDGGGSMGLSPIRPSLIPQTSTNATSISSSSSHSLQLSPSSSSPPSLPSTSPSTTLSPPQHEGPPRAYCVHPSCISPHTGLSTRSYSRKADVQRHHRSVHERRYIDCPYKKCSRKGDHGFTRNDHLMEHRRQFHMEQLGKKGVGKKGVVISGRIEKGRKGGNGEGRGR